ncbi:WxL domain-containing protein [Enterococcus casseliflavus]|nr:WxL domain-containing protein [Enterococcus casseliflavus]
MKRKDILLSTIVLTSVFVGVSTGFAAEGSGTPGVPAKGEGSVSFKENTSVTPPVNPDDPSKPNPEGIPDEGNNKTDAGGPLSLDVYPSLFDFGENNVDMSEQVYNSNITGKHYLQVTDNRSDANGWSVAVSRTEFKMENSTLELIGSTFVLPLELAIGRNSLSVTPALADSKLMTAGENVEIPVGIGNAVTIFGADGTANVGKSTSTYTWDASKETLTVKQNTAKQGTFKSIVNWTVSVTPAS